MRTHSTPSLNPQANHILVFLPISSILGIINISHYQSTLKATSLIHWDSTSLADFFRRGAEPVNSSYDFMNGRKIHFFVNKVQVMLTLEMWATIFFIIWLKGKIEDF